MVTVVAGPVLIVAQFVAALGSFGGPGSTPVADALIPIAAFASFLGGVGAVALGGRWWTGVLCASPGLLQLLLGTNDPLTNLVYLMQLASPIAVIIDTCLTAMESGRPSDALSALHRFISFVGREAARSPRTRAPRAALPH